MNKLLKLAAKSTISCIKALLLVAALGLTMVTALAAPSNTQSSTSPALPDPAAMLKWLEIHDNPLSNRTFTHIDSGWIPGQPLIWTRVQFDGPHSDTGSDSGRTLLVWSPKSTEPLWTQSWYHDSTAHSLRWADFDGDGQLDLLVMSGEEDYYETELFLWRGQPMANAALNPKPKPYSPKTMISFYQSFTSYATMLDINNDGIPELLHNGLKGDRAGYGLCEDVGLDFRFSAKSAQQSKAQYIQLAGQFADQNLMYNPEAPHAVHALDMLSPVRLIQFDASGRAQLVHLPVDHLQWRIRFLQDQTKLNKGKCLTYVRRAIRHNQLLLKEALSGKVAGLK